MLSYGRFLPPENVWGRVVHIARWTGRTDTRRVPARQTAIGTGPFTERKCVFVRGKNMATDGTSLSQSWQRWG